MKKIIVKPSKISREVIVPSSKSQTHRAILLGSLARNRSIIKRPLISSDTSAMVQACRHLGAAIKVEDNSIEIQGLDGKIVGSEDVIHAHNSGIVLRFISAIAALGTLPIVITGDESIRHQRPMHVFLDVLKQLNVKALSTKNNGYAPLIIQGPLKSGKCYIQDGSDSQNVSALLLASIFLRGTMELEVSRPGERPWIEMTLDWLKRLGVPYSHKNYESYRVVGTGGYEGFNYTVPGDWSSAAFPIAAALVTRSSIVLENLDKNDLQGDKKIVDIFLKMGARLNFDEEHKKLYVLPTEKLKGVAVDINDCIDAVTILAVVACYAEGETYLLNAHVARQKECNRLACITHELNKMGGNVIETADGLMIKGTPLQGSSVFSHQDHRMAMALVVAALGAKSESKIHETHCIHKTYPSFVQDFQTLGANLEEIE